MSSYVPERVLPWDRGSTLGDNGAWTPTIDDGVDLEGRCFLTDDTINLTSEEIVLRIVRNESGGALTCEKKFYRWASGYFNRRVAGLCNAAGMVGKPMDEQYVDDSVTSIAEHDLFYLIEAGPTKVLTEAGAVALAAHAAIATDNAGLINGVAAQAGEAELGTVSAAATLVDTEVLVMIKGDVHPSQA